MAREPVLTKDEIKALGIDPLRIPNHVAVIMDGNGRWAKNRLLPRKVGHKQGSEALRETIKACVRLHIKTLSVYAFSTENWSRPNTEVSFLMNFFQTLLNRERLGLHDEGAQVRCLGNIAQLSPALQSEVQKTHDLTQHNSRIQVNLMINYGSRHELTTACQSIAERVQNGELAVHDISESVINDHLFTAPASDPDILIRTGGNNIRLSNFLLWQCAYTEFFFLNLLWPDFRQEHLVDIITQFQNRNRNFGGLQS